jgi:hypothetical protein
MQTFLQDRYIRHEVAAPRAVGPSGRTDLLLDRHQSHIFQIALHRR